MSLQDILIQFEIHSPQGIKKCFDDGVNPNQLHNGKPLVYELINMYTRGPRFKDCLKVFIDNGLIFEDNLLLAILLDDAESLKQILISKPDSLNTRYSLPCTYTPLFEATLLHVCAEYNLVKCAEILVAMGADVNARAGVDEHGFGGQTPIFHTVNQNTNQSAEMMNFLLEHSADLKITVPGLIWGKGYEWETFIPAVNPISYAMMGLLPQMHRSERTISDVVSVLIKKAYGIDFNSANIPNAYLKK